MAQCVSCGRELAEGSLYCNTCGAAQNLPYRKLYRSTAQRQLLGVCGGFAEYWELDPTVIRVLYVVLTFFSGILPGVVLYLILALIMPKR
ncbi:MAG: PspC domain-containing protein [Thermoanaerobaculum sp.]|nr:PspC domain-containing protein [Thermoanaerobaculum sp.]MDW7967021.1 PspC domain-containing protein [Thermoanaerobaculum sp.]